MQHLAGRGAKTSSGPDIDKDLADDMATMKERVRNMQSQRDKALAQAKKAGKPVSSFPNWQAGRGKRQKKGNW